MIGVVRTAALVIAAAAATFYVVALFGLHGLWGAASEVLVVVSIRAWRRSRRAEGRSRGWIVAACVAAGALVLWIVVTTIRLAPLFA